MKHSAEFSFSSESLKGNLKADGIENQTELQRFSEQFFSANLYLKIAGEKVVDIK